MTAGDKQPELPAELGQKMLFCVSTGSATPRVASLIVELRLKMQKVMQSNCAVFRTGDVLDEGHKLIHEVFGGVPELVRLGPFADLEFPT